MKTERVKLTQPHEHEDKPHAIGDELTLDAGTAKWLKELGRAVAADEPKGKSRAGE